MSAPDRRGISDSEIRQRSLFPEDIAGFRLVDEDIANQCLVDWGHWLGPCNRPFGKQSWALFLDGRPISVAVSASTVNARCGGYGRNEVVELARLASHPEHPWATRVCLRLWREVAAERWPYWPPKAALSYSNAVRHTGNIYRFDGWKRIGDVPGGTAGGDWSRKKAYDPKSIWVWEFESNER